VLITRGSKTVQRNVSDPRVKSEERSGVIIVNIRIKICVYRLGLLSVNRILEYIGV
jgi:hypothetical protein